MQNKKNVEIDQKTYNTLKKLMENKKFLNKLLNIHSGSGIAKIFDSYGVDIKKLEFEDLCDFLVNTIKPKDLDISVKSLEVPIAIDYENKSPKIIVNVKD